MTRRNYTADMKRTALAAVSNFFSMHQAEMSPHELVEATHLLHAMAVADERSCSWAAKRRQKLGLPGAATFQKPDGAADDLLPDSPGSVSVALAGLESTLQGQAAFTHPPDHVEPVRRPPVPVPIPPRRVAPTEPHEQFPPAATEKQQAPTRAPRKNQPLAAPPAAAGIPPGSRAGAPAL